MSGRKGNLLSISRVFFARKEFGSDSKAFQKNRGSENEEEEKINKFNQASHKRATGKDGNKNWEADRRKIEDKEDEDDRFDVYRTKTVWASRDGNAFGYRYAETTVPRSLREDDDEEAEESYNSRTKNSFSKKDAQKYEDEKSSSLNNSSRNFRNSRSSHERENGQKNRDEDSKFNLRNDNVKKNSQDFEAKGEREEREDYEDHNHQYADSEDSKLNENYGEDHEALANDEGFGFGIYNRKVQYFSSEPYERGSLERKNYKEENKQNNMRNNPSWGKTTKRENWGTFSNDKQGNKGDAKGTFGQDNNQSYEKKR